MLPSTITAPFSRVAISKNSVLVDEDFTSQIAINLVYNALKFSAKADRREVRI